MTTIKDFMKKSKIQKNDIIDAIEFYLRKNGRKLSNIRSVNLDKLNASCMKLNIDYQIAYNEYMIDKQIKKEREEAADKLYNDARENERKQNEIILNKWNSLTNEQKIHIQNITYDTEYQRITDDFELGVRMCKIACEEALLKGFNVEYIEGDCNAKISYVNYSFGHKPLNKEVWTSNRKWEWFLWHYDNTKIMVDEFAYHNNMIQRGFYKKENGKYCKTIIVKKTKDYIGEYMGDNYGCSDQECKRCVRCNPLLWWLNRRPIKRPDMAIKACAEIKKYDNKRSNAYINGFNDGFIDEDYNLLK